ncbi:MAG: Outer-membrane lipoprotein LolB [Burkholderiaceae bacterium]|nr:Outer-membrane lipoprotein LolB [Burkholderiaceae bacterium]
MSAVGRRAALWFLAAASSLLSACASLTPPPRDTGTLLSGRLSVRVDSDPPRALSAAFELSGNARSGALVLTSPLGSTLAQAHWTPDEAVLETPSARTSYPDVDALAEHALGERVPLAALFDWLRGRPWAGAASRALRDDERGFTQLGWRVTLPQGAHGWVEAHRNAAPAVTLRARIDGATS